MKLDQLVALIIRLFIVYVFVSVVYQQIAGIFMMALELAQSGERPMLGALIGASVATIAILIFGVLLWKCSPFIARKVISTSDASTIKLSLSFEEIQEICFSTIGLSVMISGILAFTRDISFYKFLSMFQHQSEVRVDYQPQLHALADTLHILIGLYLLLGARGIINLLKKIRGGIR